VSRSIYKAFDFHFCRLHSLVPFVPNILVEFYSSLKPTNILTMGLSLPRGAAAAAAPLLLNLTQKTLSSHSSWIQLVTNPNNINRCTNSSSSRSLSLHRLYHHASSFKSLAQAVVRVVIGVTIIS